MKPKSRQNCGKYRGSNLPVVTPQPTLQRLKLNMDSPPACWSISTSSNSEDDFFRQRLFVPNQASQMPTSKSLKTQQFESFRNQLQDYNNLERVAARSLSELAKQDRLGRSFAAS